MPEYGYQPSLIKARFVTRINRFVAGVKLNGEEHLAHLPTTGRLRELLANGAEVWLRPTPGIARLTQYSLELVRSTEGELVCINSQLPNRLVELWFEQKRFAAFEGYMQIEREPRLGDGRSDLRLVGSEGDCLVEIKSVTLVVGGEARFPDAPTARGTRHLHELTAARLDGRRAAVFFVIQRNDARSFAPNVATDPEFACALRKAQAVGWNSLRLRASSPWKA